MEEYKLWLEKQIEKCQEDKDLQREHWAFCKAYEKLFELLSLESCPDCRTHSNVN